MDKHLGRVRKVPVTHTEALSSFRGRDWEAGFQSQGGSNQPGRGEGVPGVFGEYLKAGSWVSILE